MDVYESTYNDIPLMRRCDDNWVNATQILKIAGYGKAQRTRILEKEVHQHEHRKIQGGFGRFQGTWVPLEFARKLAQVHNLTKDQVKVLYYDPAIDGPLPKKMKHRPERKRRKNAGKPTAKRPKKARKRGRKPKKGSVDKQSEDTVKNDSSKLPPTFGMFERKQQDSQLSGNSIPGQQQPAHYGSYPIYANGQQQQQAQQVTQQQITTQQIQAQQSQQIPLQVSRQAQPPHNNHRQPEMFAPIVHFDGTPRMLLQEQQLQAQRAPHQAGQNFDYDYQKYGMNLGRQGSATLDRTAFKGSAQNPQQQLSVQRSQSQVQSLQPPVTDAEMEEEECDYYTDRLLTFFSNDGEPVPEFLFNPPADFDINRPIDNEGHTPLHWASALALPSIVELLLSKNANPLMLNSAGMNCLSKLIHFTNSFDTKNFMQILGLLRQCLIVPDARGRTPLHYLMELTSDSTKHDCLMYYLSNIISFIKSQQTEAQKLQQAGSENLLNVLFSHRDNDGLNILDIALKLGSDDFAKLLLDSGVVKNEESNTINAVIHENPTLKKLQEMSVDPVDSSTAKNSLVSNSHVNREDSTITDVAADGSENKENMFDNTSTVRSVKANSSMANPPRQVSTSVMGAHVTLPKGESSFTTSTPSKKFRINPELLRYKVGNTKVNVDSFASALPVVVSKVGENLTDEISGKDEELKHNLKTIVNLDKEINSVSEKCGKLLKNTFNSIEDLKFNSLLQSSKESDRTKLFKVFEAKIDDYKKMVATKRDKLFNDYERSQALEVAKIVNEEENKISDYVSEDETDGNSYDTLRLAIKLTLLQVQRKKLVGNKVQSVVAGGGDPQLWGSIDGPSISGCSKGFSEEQKMQAKMYLYKKLISNICDLPMDEINKDLLDGIELRLQSSQVTISH